MPLAKILTEKVVVRGEKCRRILGFDGILEKEMLPKRYIVPFQDDQGFYRPTKDIPPYFYLDPEMDYRVFLHAPVDGPFFSFWIATDQVIFEELFQEIILWMKRAGARLSKINKRIAEEGKEWKGEETIVI